MKTVKKTSAQTILDGRATKKTVNKQIIAKMDSKKKVTVTKKKTYLSKIAPSDMTEEEKKVARKKVKAQAAKNPTPKTIAKGGLREVSSKTLDKENELVKGGMSRQNAQKASIAWRNKTYGKVGGNSNYKSEKNQNLSRAAQARHNANIND